MRALRIHHLFDIIRDYGAGKTLSEHAYGHSYHTVGKEVYENKLSRIKLVVKSDDVCVNCQKLNSEKCIDSICHRTDFTSKEAFNNYLDMRIMKSMKYSVGQIIEVKDIIENADKYLDAIFDIYKGNDTAHTEQRKQDVSAGINKKRKELFSGL